ncbi:MAG: GNAT family N-acetyltransferase [Chloroflexota bacterium]
MYQFCEFTFTDAEYARCVNLHNAILPDAPETVIGMRQADAHRNPDVVHQRWLIHALDPALMTKVDGQAVGVAWVGGSSRQTGKYDVGFNLDTALGDAAYAEGGLADVILAHMMTFLKQKPHKPTLLTAGGREDQTAFVQFVIDRGFDIVERNEISELNLVDFNSSDFRVATEKAKNNGIEIMALPELQATDDDWKVKLYDLHMAIMPDVPSISAFVPPPMAEWEKMFTYDDFLPAAWFIAMHDNHYVGVTNLRRNAQNPKTIPVGLTGVRREYRRQGIATAVKLRSIEFAQAQGCISMVTGNEENNPMFQINLRFGFQPLPAWLNFHRKMTR